MFLKLKSDETQKRVLIAASEIASVHEADAGSVVTLRSGEELSVKEGYQTLVNRLTNGE